MKPERTQYLLTIRGSLASETLDASRAIHNETAGTAANIAAARSLGDLSHLVYVPADGAARELLIMDVWNSMEGLNQFFANPQVHEQAGRIFSKREPVVWRPLDGAFRFTLAAPTKHTSRYVGLIRGTAKSLDDARRAIDDMSSSTVNEARKLGLLSHDLYVRATPPGQPESAEILGVETWHDGDGMAKWYSQGEKALAGVFTGIPDASVWKQPAGSWVEW